MLVNYQQKLNMKRMRKKKRNCLRNRKKMKIIKIRIMIVVLNKIAQTQLQMELLFRRKNKMI